MRIAGEKSFKIKRARKAPQKNKSRTNSSEENYKLPKEEVSENKRQRRREGDKQRGIPRSKATKVAKTKREKAKS